VAPSKPAEESAPGAAAAPGSSTPLTPGMAPGTIHATPKEAAPSTPPKDSDDTGKPRLQPPANSHPAPPDPSPASRAQPTKPDRAA
jgi:hypothetical protein